MPPPLKPYTTLIDFITGRETPDIGAEENRQVVERFLVEQKGYARQDIAVDADLELTIQGEPYRSQVDLVVTVGGLSAHGHHLCGRLARVLGAADRGGGPPSREHPDPARRRLRRPDRSRDRCRHGQDHRRGDGGDPVQSRRSARAYIRPV